MNKNLLKEWIWFLKNNQIVSSKMDATSKKLNYRRPVYSSDLERFLHLHCPDDLGIEMDAWENLASKVINHYSTKKRGGTIKLTSDSAIVDDPGVELIESEVVAIVKKITELATKSVLKIKTEELVKRGMSNPQRKMLLQHIECFQRKVAPIKLGKVKAFFFALSRKESSGGIFKYLPKKSVTPKLYEIEARWAAQGCPIIEDELLDFSRSLGFSEAKLVECYKNAADHESDEGFNIDYGYNKSIEIVSNFLSKLNNSELELFKEYVKKMTGSIGS